MFVPIGGIEQWVQIGPDDPANPVLLCLHGGPGGSTRPAVAAWRRWERHFTVVHWDQRGAGKTFGRNGEAGCGRLTIDRMVADAIELTEFLKTHLGRSKIMLVGHSWGSVLGIHLIRMRPDLFSAFVGTGQVVNMRRNEAVNYTRQLAQARAAGNAEALTALEAIGAPPYSDIGKIRVLRHWSDRLAPGMGDAVQPQPTPPPGSEDFSAADVGDLMGGFAFSGSQLFEELSAVDLPSLGPDFDVPVFIFHGTEDQQTPVSLAEDYFATLNAPRKAFVRFEGCHHFVVMNRPDDFLKALLEHARPVAVAAD